MGTTVEAVSTRATADRHDDAGGRTPYSSLATMRRAPTQRFQYHRPCGSVSLSALT